MKVADVMRERNLIICDCMQCMIQVAGDAVVSSCSTPSDEPQFMLQGHLQLIGVAY